MDMDKTPAEQEVEVADEGQGPAVTIAPKCIVHAMPWLELRGCQCEEGGSGDQSEESSGGERRAVLDALNEKYFP